jgi:hypothetical protein
MLNDEIASAVSKFFEAGKGPSHDELTRMFKRANLDRFDPVKLDPGVTVGKMKRCREVLSCAIDEDIDAGSKLVKMIVGTLKASGAFREGSENYAGPEQIAVARQAFNTAGFELDPEGNLRPALLENLNDQNATEALLAYVRRARLGVTDAALVVGTGKDLLEATARHVLIRTTGDYPKHGNFQMTLFQAFEMLHLKTPSLDLIQKLDNTDPVRGVQEALCLLGMAVNRLRNAEGTGHGRPFLPSLIEADAKLATQAMGIVSEYLMQKLGRQT